MPVWIHMHITTRSGSYFSFSFPTQDAFLTFCLSPWLYMNRNIRRSKALFYRFNNERDATKTTI